MMMHFKYIDRDLKLSEDKICVLVVENKKLFRSMICSFENDEPEEFFTFSSQFKPFAFSEKGAYLSNLLNIELNSKKLLTKINAYLAQSAETEFFENLTAAKRELLALAQKLAEWIDFDCEYNYDIPSQSIIKLLDFRAGTPDDTPAQQLIGLIELMSKYLKTQLYVFPYFHMLFDREEIELIYDTLLQKHVRILALECMDPAIKLPHESYYILDADLCEIYGGDA